MKIAIIGAGISGLACADRLAAAGHAVKLFDKGRGPGGRMSTRRLSTPDGDVFFDHGAQYFTARHPLFQVKAAQWMAQGLVMTWPAAGSEALVGTPGMNAPVQAMAKAHDVTWSVLISSISPSMGGWRVDGEGIEPQRFDAVVVAVPAEQVGPLIAPFALSIAERSNATPSAPCWTAMAAFAGKLTIGADIVRTKGPIIWACRNSAKPARANAEAWVIQANPEWSRAHRGMAPDLIVDLLLEELAHHSGDALPTCTASAGHSWLYARSGSAGEGALWNDDQRVGACGDWLLGPRIESAWLSGDQLGMIMTQSLERRT